MNAKKILTIGVTELTMLVKSKSFLIGLALMPLLMGGVITLSGVMTARADTSTRHFAVIDASERLFPAIAEAARQADAARASGRDGTGPRFVPEEVPAPSASLDAVRLELSDRVRRGDLFAFVEIPADVLGTGSAAPVRYYSNHPTYQALPAWLRTVINEAVRAERFDALQVDRAGMEAMLREVGLQQLRLFARGEEGRIAPAAHVDHLRAMGLAIGLPFLLYMFVMVTAPQLLNAVIEEKMSRIAEVMLGSVTASELMAGKLLGNVGAAFVLTAVYVGGGAAALRYLGYGDMLAVGPLAWFCVFLVLALLIFGSMFLAIGAACTDLHDAQTMMTPAMMMAVVPFVLSFTVVRSPETPVSAVLSMIPPFTPFLMLVRVALDPGPPLWQLLLAVLFTAAAAVVFVWAAGRIFRVGLLMQGKSATFREMVRWVRAS